MPASRSSVELTNRYRATLLDLRAQAASTAARLWLALDLSDLDTSYATWRAGVLGAVEASKRTSVTLSDAYLAAYVASELGAAPAARGLDPEPYMDTEDGRPLAQALLPPLFTVKAALAARRPDALRLGLVRATRIVSEEVSTAPRRALGDLMASDERIEGWRRVVSGRPCGACLAQADGRVHAPADPFNRHGHCRCLREAVLRGVPERVIRPTGREVFDSLSPAEQDALFHGRGGVEKADLVRSGAVPLDALVKHERQAVGPDQFTEASLADLRLKTPAPRDAGADEPLQED